MMKPVPVSETIIFYMLQKVYYVVVCIVSLSRR